MPKVLIAEDDFLIADMLQEAATQEGYDVCGIATEPSEVIALGEQHKPDLAVIDVRLARGSDGIQAAIELASRLRVGILYATGNCHVITDNPPPVGEACVDKPFTMRDILQALKLVEQIVQGHVPPSVPRNVHLLRRATSS
jgi:two-component system, response regulator PdtaR